MSTTIKHKEVKVGEFTVVLPNKCGDYRCRYPGQFEMQDTFVEIDWLEKTIEARYNPEIGNAVPMRYYYGYVTRIPFSCKATLKEVKEMLPEMAGFADKIVHLFDTRWDGNNTVGYWVRPEEATWVIERGMKALSVRLDNDIASREALRAFRGRGKR